MAYSSLKISLAEATCLFLLMQRDIHSVRIRLILVLTVGVFSKKTSITLENMTSGYVLVHYDQKWLRWNIISRTITGNHCEFGWAWVGEPNTLTNCPCNLSLRFEMIRTQAYFVAFVFGALIIGYILVDESVFGVGRQPNGCLLSCFSFARDKQLELVNLSRSLSKTTTTDYTYFWYPSFVFWPVLLVSPGWKPCRRSSYLRCGHGGISYKLIGSGSKWSQHHAHAPRLT